MQTSARYQAVLELIEAVFQDKMPADNIINQYMRTRRYIGSKDRRFICECVWDIIRHRRRLSFDGNTNEPRKILLLYLKNEDFDLICGGQYGLKPLSKEEKEWFEKARKNEEVYPPDVASECPKWLFDKIGDTALISSLNRSASADIRANFISATELQKKLHKEGLFFSLTPYAPFGLRAAERVNLNNCIAYREGLFDVQDEACQVAALLCNIKPKEKIIDYCAGAGGKSMALACILENKGVVYCHDADVKRMDPIKERAERLGVKNLCLLENVEDTDFDCFVVDAPCSGTGTWQRAPDAKFRLTEQKLEVLTKTQSDILEAAYRHTKKGGRIVYMTCSVLRDENEDIVQKFADTHKDICFVSHKDLWDSLLLVPYPFQTDKYIRFSPLVTNTDGFFFCMMKKV